MVLVTAVSQDERPGLDFFPLTCEFVEKTTPPADPRRPSSSARPASATRRSSPAGSWTGPSGRSSPTASRRTRRSSPPSSPGQAEQGRRPGAHRRQRGAAHLRHPLERAHRRRPRRPQGGASSSPTRPSPTWRPATSISSSPARAKPSSWSRAAPPRHRERHHRRPDVRPRDGPAGPRSHREDPRRRGQAQEGVHPPPSSPPTSRARFAAIVVEDLKKATKVTDKKARYEGYKGLKKKFQQALAAELGAAEYLPLEKLCAAEYRGAQGPRRPQLRARRGPPHRRPRHPDGAPHHVRGGAPPARARERALPARRDAGHRHHPPWGRRATSRQIDGLMGETWKRFYLHYNFPRSPPARPSPMAAAPARREIGHGALAERALSRMIPAARPVPYTIRIVSETLSPTAPRRWPPSAAAASR